MSVGRNTLRKGCRSLSAVPPNKNKNKMGYGIFGSDIVGQSRVLGIIEKARVRAGGMSVESVSINLFYMPAANGWMDHVPLLYAPAGLYVG
jgi:hypothetical protein